MYNVSAGIGKEILYSPNLFAKECAKFAVTNSEKNSSELPLAKKGNPSSESTKADNFELDNSNEVAKLALRDLEILEKLAATTAESVVAFLLSSGAFYSAELESLPLWEIGEGYRTEKIAIGREFSKNLEQLKSFYSENGYGNFIDNKAFFWRDNKIVPVTHPDPIKLSELKEYSTQKNTVVSNTAAFLAGHKANNILLYGDRGTGKSSTVKAILNEFYQNKLRLIEISKSGLHTLPFLTEQLCDVPLKFIIFVDDLSFSEDDEDFSMLKAVLEGGVSSLPDNVLIYATSNRRHLVKESFSSRQGDEVHRADTIQETVSLSDRFGIVLTYFMPAKREFLEIVSQMAKDEGIEMDSEELLKKAESWAITRGARSPRYARQFITDLKAKQKD